MVEGGHTTESNFTETTLLEKAGFTVEHNFGLIFGTVVSVETVFENEADRQAVTEVFRTLDAPTGARLHAGIHREGVLVCDAGLVHIDVGVVQTQVNDTVELKVSSESGTGESTENCNSSQSLFHDLSPSLFPDLQELSFCKNRRTEPE